MTSELKALLVKTLAKDLDVNYLLSQLHSCPRDTSGFKDIAPSILEYDGTFETNEEIIEELVQALSSAESDIGVWLFITPTATELEHYEVKALGYIKAILFNAVAINKLRETLNTFSLLDFPEHKFYSKGRLNSYQVELKYTDGEDTFQAGDYRTTLSGTCRFVVTDEVPDTTGRKLELSTNFILDIELLRRFRPIATDSDTSFNPKIVLTAAISHPDTSYIPAGLGRSSSYFLAAFNIDDLKDFIKSKCIYYTEAFLNEYTKAGSVAYMDRWKTRRI